MLTFILSAPMYKIKHATKATVCLSLGMCDPCTWQKKPPGIACGLGMWAEWGLEIPRREVIVTVQFLGREACPPSSFAEGLTYTRVSWEEKILFSSHSSQASSSSTWMMENGFPWSNAGRAAGVTASHNSGPSAKTWGRGSFLCSVCSVLKTVGTLNPGSSLRVHPQDKRQEKQQLCKEQSQSQTVKRRSHWEQGVKTRGLFPRLFFLLKQKGT